MHEQRAISPIFSADFNAAMSYLMAHATFMIIPDTRLHIASFDA